MNIYLAYIIGALLGLIVIIDLIYKVRNWKPNQRKINDILAAFQPVAERLADPDGDDFIDIVQIYVGNKDNPSWLSVIVSAEHIPLIEEAMDKIRSQNGSN